MVVLCCHWVLDAGTINQAGRTLPYFSPHGSPTSWDGSKSSITQEGGATVAHIGGRLPVDMSQGAGALKLETTLPSGYWNIILRLGVGQGLNWNRVGGTPLLRIRAKWESIAPGADIEIGIQTRADDRQSLAEAKVLLSQYATPSLSWQDIYIPLSDFESKEVDLNPSRVTMIRMYGKGVYSSANTVYFEKIEVVPSEANPYLDAIKINQIGYTPGAPKKVIVSFEEGAYGSTLSNFSVVSKSTGQSVYSGSLSKQTKPVGKWDLSSDEVYHGDFTSFNAEGDYYIRVDEISQQSQSFTIANTAYNSIFRDVLRFFYYARSGEAIVEPYAEGYPRDALWDEISSYDYQSGSRDVRGGLFDAGDMHMDVHAQVETMWYLLETLKSFGDKVSPGGLNIPESSQDVSDLYPLIEKQLRWMMKMANPDGSVHYWVSQDVGIGAKSEVSDVSSGSASIVAAFFAKAYPLYKGVPQYSGFADTLLMKAEQSWDWLLAHPGNVNPVNPADGNNYPYALDDGRDQAHRAMAAIELYNATGDDEYHEYFTSRFSDPLSDYHQNIAWGGIIQNLDQSYINLAYLDYVNSSQPGVNTSIQNTLKVEFKKLADWVIGHMATTSYDIPLAAHNHLYWGSSGSIATYGYLFNQVAQWENDPSYLSYIADCSDWILGRNPVNRIFVTGYGDQAHGVDNYSFYWEDIANPAPGYLTGNINEFSYLDEYIEDPSKRFINIQNAALLEPGIYWNAQMSWLMGYYAYSEDFGSVGLLENQLENSSLEIEKISIRSEFIEVEFNQAPTGQELVYLYNLKGSQLITPGSNTTLRGASLKISRQSIPNGVYWLRIKTLEGQLAKKIQLLD